MSPNPMDLLAQVQRLQAEIAQAREELAEQTVEVSVGGGAVRLIMTGTQECRQVAIDPGVLKAEDADLVQDMMVGAINQAIRESQQLAARRLGPLTGGLGGL
ncbi:MAG: YbaB/EbfC family nucleoid-associated protein [Anaerolineales bacterium]|nr:YbaB/EbfC family nucleoid-associated protein [Anaerolineales bacterium]